jgi:hypothetical protein
MIYFHLTFIKLSSNHLSLSGANFVLLIVFLYEWLIRIIVFFQFCTGCFGNSGINCCFHLMNKSKQANLYIFSKCRSTLVVTVNSPNKIVLHGTICSIHSTFAKNLIILQLILLFRPIRIEFIYLFYLRLFHIAFLKFKIVMIFSTIFKLNVNYYQSPLLTFYRLFFLSSKGTFQFYYGLFFPTVKSWSPFYWTIPVIFK